MIRPARQRMIGEITWQIAQLCERLGWKVRDAHASGRTSTRYLYLEFPGCRPKKVHAMIRIGDHPGGPHDEPLPCYSWELRRNWGQSFSLLRAWLWGRAAEALALGANAAPSLKRFRRGTRFGLRAMGMA